ncbi:hypothetical protein ACQP1U_05900 [Actinomycetota bacterium]
MSFTEAALLVAWLAIAVLALGLAGLMRQHDDLRRRISELTAQHGHATGGLTGLHLPADGPLGAARPVGGGIVLFVSPGCPSCEGALADVRAHGVAGELVVVSAGSCPETHGARCVGEAREILDRLSVPATPYLMEVAADGEIGATLLPSDAHEIASWLDHVATARKGA